MLEVIKEVDGIDGGTYIGIKSYEKVIDNLGTLGQVTSLEKLQVEKT